MMIVRAGAAAGFTQIPNATLRDESLSWKARGLLCYLLSHETGWRIDSASLAERGPDGRDAVRSGLRELEAAGYLVRTRTHGEGGRWVVATFVYDRPQTTAPIPGITPTHGHRPHAGPAVLGVADLAHVGDAHREDEQSGRNGYKQSG